MNLKCRKGNISHVPWYERMIELHTYLQQRPGCTHLQNARFLWQASRQYHTGRTRLLPVRLGCKRERCVPSSVRHGRAHFRVRLPRSVLTGWKIFPTQTTVQYVFGSLSRPEANQQRIFGAQFKEDASIRGTWATTAFPGRTFTQEYPIVVNQWKEEVATWARANQWN